MKIFDVEEEKCFEDVSYLRIITSLDGISQINLNNNLYLCGTNDDSSNSISSFLLKIDLNKEPYSSLVLVSSIYSHFNPCLANWKNEHLIVIGGKGQTKCEMYNINFPKWKEITSLPEERYKATIFMDERSGNLYLFGGISTYGGFNIKTILRLGIEIEKRWEMIVVKENENFLARNSSAAFKFDNSQIIYICGGKDSNGKETEYITEFNMVTKGVRKFEASMKRPCSFELQNGADLNKMHFAFFDSNNYIHTISRNEFRMSVIKFEDLRYSNYGTST